MEMGSHSILFLLYLNIFLSWPEDGRLQPKHVAKYNVIVIIAFLGRPMLCIDGT